MLSEGRELMANGGWQMVRTRNKNTEKINQGTI